jgi:tetratricopeptide (TPR) repeat protein
MKKYSLLLSVLFFAVFGMAEKIHEPSEILKMLMDSKIKYEVKMLKTPVPSKDYSKKVNALNFYRVVTDSTITTVNYTLRDSAQHYFDKAESFFDSNPDSALIYYTLMRTAQPELYFGLTYTGQLFERKGEFRTAIEWYKQSINVNYIDYMAHWFLADAYVATGELDKALDEILIAQILNRNNERIKKSLVTILKKSKLKTEDWYFNPQVILSKDSDNKVNVEMGSQWFGYGMAKALWEFEPGYRQSMGVDSGEISTTEYKECLFCQVVSMENSKLKIKKIPQFRILKDAAYNKHLNEYILYEIILPEIPFVACQLSEESISDIKDYLINVRYKK